MFLTYLVGFYVPKAMLFFILYILFGVLGTVSAPAGHDFIDAFVGLAMQLAFEPFLRIRFSSCFCIFLSFPPRRKI